MKTYYMITVKQGMVGEAKNNGARYHFAQGFQVVARYMPALSKFEFKHPNGRVFRISIEGVETTDREVDKSGNPVEVK